MGKKRRILTSSKYRGKLSAHPISRIRLADNTDTTEAAAVEESATVSATTTPIEAAISVESTEVATPTLKTETANTTTPTKTTKTTKSKTRKTPTRARKTRTKAKTTEATQ